MKKHYESPVFDLFALSQEDVIATSGFVKEEEGAGDEKIWEL